MNTDSKGHYEAPLFLTPVENSVNHGTASPVRSWRLPWPGCCKLAPPVIREVWFAGYTPDTAAAIYIGTTATQPGIKPVTVAMAAYCRKALVVTLHPCSGKLSNIYA